MPKKKSDTMQNESDAVFRNLYCESIEIGLPNSLCRALISADKSAGISFGIYDAKSIQRVLIQSDPTGVSSIALLDEKGSTLMSIAQNDREYGIVFWTAEKQLRQVVQESK